MVWYLFFFFKQKTAYEMRISDWSSDVCSSDLPRQLTNRHWLPAGRAEQQRDNTARGVPRDFARGGMTAINIAGDAKGASVDRADAADPPPGKQHRKQIDRKSTRLNSSH